jgi:hypothetical protein
MTIKNKITYINDRIEKEFCNNIVDKLTDNNLLDEYKKSKSVKNNIKDLTNILVKYNINDDNIKSIINDYQIQLIPPGTKGSIRGNKFNIIVKEKINSLKLDINKFDIQFEKECNICKTSEKPDWYILEKSTNKIIIGMNQLDLWGGGQQLNRGYKYIENNKHNNINSKLLCVVCNEIQFKSKKNKTYKLFKIGFENNTLTYLNNLQNIISSYFN